MKINQLFTKPVDLEIAIRLVECLGLNDLNDSRNFTKYDLIRVDSVGVFGRELLRLLKDYYLPCKAKLYLQDITEKKLITVVKQVLRLHNYSVLAKEKNFGTKKVIVYRISGWNDYNKIGMHKLNTQVHVDFD
jgi:hypothetical protein